MTADDDEVLRRLTPEQRAFLELMVADDDGRQFIEDYLNDDEVPANERDQYRAELKEAIDVLKRAINLHLQRMSPEDS